MRRYLLLSVPILLGGCGLPPAVAIASYVADGVSYLVTGKSVTDHGISEATGRDCATWRLIKFESPCKKEPAQREEPAPVVEGELASAPPKEPSEDAPPAAAPHRYLVLGSFGNRQNADRFSAEFPDVKTAVIEATIDGRTTYRVMAGPLSDDEVDDLRAKLAAENRPPAWEFVAALPGA